MPELLCLEGVWKGFARGGRCVSVFEDVSLSVAAGEVVAVVGARAQGKTTLVRLASGTLAPDHGTVRVDGRDLSVLKDKQLSWVLASEIGFARREGPGMRVRAGDYVEMALAAAENKGRWFGLLGWAERRRERRVRVSAVFERLGVAHCADARWADLSNWERVMVELAQAIVVSPRLLLIDDLTDGFNIGEKQAVVELLEGFAEEIGCGVLMAVSDFAAATSALRVWRLDQRKLRLMADHTEPNVFKLHSSSAASGA